jgi:hypothetical protein
MSTGSLLETRANLISIDPEFILVASGGDYVKFILDWYLTKENLKTILTFYDSLKTALDADVTATGAGAVVKTSLAAWLTSKSVTFAKVKAWIEANAVTTADTGFAKQLDKISDVSDEDALITLSKTAGNPAKVAFRVAILNIRDSRNDALKGDGFYL